MTDYSIPQLQEIQTTLRSTTIETKDETMTRNVLQYIVPSIITCMRAGVNSV